MGNISHTTGSVGIGTSTPVANTPLLVQGVGDGLATIRLQIAGSGGLLNYGSMIVSGTQASSTVESKWINSFVLEGVPLADSTGASGSTIISSYDRPLLFQTGNRAERMRITTNGNVGIGTDAPTVKLDVNGGMALTGKATSASTVFTDGGTTLVTKDFLYPATGWIFYNSSLTGSLGGISEFSSTSSEGAIHTILNGTFRRVSASSNINILLLEGGIGITNASTGGPTNPRTIARIVMTLPDGNDVTYDYPVSNTINTVYVKRIVLTAAQLVAGFTTLDIQTQSLANQTPPGNAGTNNHPAGAGTYVLKKISFYVYGNTSAGGTQVNSGTVLGGGYISDVNGYAQNRVMVIES